MPLDPEVAAHLERQKDQRPRSALTIGETREMMRRASALAGPPVELPRVGDLALPGSLCARQYWPAVDDRLPLVVYFHGGRFFSGDLDTHDSICRSLARAGRCRILAVDYRLAPEHRFPAAFDDASTAVEWALNHARNVGVAGDSAGANLAAGAAIVHRAAGLKCQLLIYPMIDATCSRDSYREFATGFGPGSADMLRGWREYLPPETDPQDPRASPLFASDLEGSAPAHVITAEYDSLRDEAEAYARRLVDAGVPATLKRYPGAIHGFIGMSGILRLAREAIADAGKFLECSFRSIC